MGGGGGRRGDEERRMGWREKAKKMYKYKRSKVILGIDWPNCQIVNVLVTPIEGTEKES